MNHKVKSLDELGQTIQYIVQLHSIIKRYELLTEYLLKRNAIMTSDSSLKSQLQVAEKIAIQEALESTGSQAGAARLLGMARISLIGRMKRLEIAKDKTNAG